MDKKRDSFDFWYAVNNTDVILMPERHLETFGTTVMNYHLITELMDSVDRVRIREGRLEAGQPQIITPDAYLQTAMEGFGDEAQQYVDWLKEHEQDIKVLQYGYKLKQESFSEHIITGDLKSVAKRVESEAKAKNDPLSAVVIGVDEPWDVCLVKLFWEVIRTSAKTNITDMNNRHLFDSSETAKARLLTELEKDFLEASKDSALINALGEKLQKHNVFDHFEDRFFSLVKAGKKEKNI